jgi:ribosomal protein S18 acetylase RimI-like enzyme
MNTQTRHIKYHLAITRAMHEANKAYGAYPELDPDTDLLLTVREIERPITFDDLKFILERVGGPYGWHLRREYHDPESVENITTKLAAPESRQFVFFSGRKQVGGAIIANLQKGIGDIFRVSADPSLRHDITSGEIHLTPEDANRTMEIYKIGLFPEYTRKGMGPLFFPQLLDQLFSDKNTEVVYLNTRSTNHNGVINFYRRLNMNVIHAQEVIDHVVSRQESPSTGNLSVGLWPRRFQPT